MGMPLMPHMRLLLISGVYIVTVNFFLVANYEVC